MNEVIQTKVSLCDDHPVVRHALKSIIQSSSKYTVISEAVDYHSAIKTLEENDPDIFLLDLNLPGKSGIETIHQIRQQNSQMKILVFSMHDEKDKIEQCLRAGANAFLTKDTGAEEILTALDKVNKGELVLAKKLEYLREELEKNIKKTSDDCSFAHPLAKLSKREREVFFLLAQGEVNRNIAKKMFLSPRTIETHRARILKKLNLNSTADIVRYAIRNNLIGI